MSDEKIWFPFYVGDYLGDTMHLDRAEHGSYLLMLCRYYKTGGPLTDDDRSLARTAGVSLSDWPATRSILAQFFIIKDGFWTHKRAEAEIKRAKTLQLARAKGAASTNEKRWKSLSDSQSDTPSDDSAYRTASRSSVGNHSHSHSHSHNQNTAQSKSQSQSEIIYAQYPRKVGRKKALLTIKAALKTYSFELVNAAVARFSDAWKGETDLQFCPHPMTWFGQERFLDSPETWKPNNHTTHTKTADHSKGF